MHDQKALQAGTSHYFGDGFAKAFDITFTGKDNQLHHPPPDLLGRVHPDDRRHHHDPRRQQRPGAAPPASPPSRPWSSPWPSTSPGVLEAARPLLDRLKAAGVRAKMDDDVRPVPRLEGRPVRDEGRAPAGGDRPQGHGKGWIRLRGRGGSGGVGPWGGGGGPGGARGAASPPYNMFAMAMRWGGGTLRYQAPTEAKAIAEGKGGFLRSKWCGSLECELAMKERAGVSPAACRWSRAAPRACARCAARSAPPTSTGAWRIDRTLRPARGFSPRRFSAHHPEPWAAAGAKTGEKRGGERLRRDLQKILIIS